MILTAEEIAAYRKQCEGMKRFTCATICCAVEDVSRLLDEVEASRLKIEQLSDKCGQLREAVNRCNR